MRVLHLCAGRLYGGIENQLVTLARHRDVCPDMEPIYTVCFEGRLADELRQASVPVHMLGNVRFSRPWSLWSARASLRRLLRKERIDAAVSHACWPHACFAPILREAKIPIAFVAHDTPQGTHWLERKAARTEPDLVLANSRHTQDAVPLLFKARSVVWNYPVREPSITDRAGIRAAMRKKLETSPQAVVIVMASRMERWKGHTLLLDALGKIKVTAEWACWIGGGAQRPEEQAYLAELQDQAARLGISQQVRFIGQRSDVEQVLVAADIHCQPNTGPEPFGIVFIEALYAGLPVVTTRMGGGQEIVTPACGILVPPGDAAGLADALTSLIDDAERRGALGAHAPQRAREICAPSVAIPRLRDELAGIIAKH